MGGNALKNCETERKNVQEYNDILFLVMNALNDEFPDSEFMDIQAYANKPSFGDMDILCGGMKGGIDYLTVLRDLFESKEIVHNGNVWSLEYRGFQIDLIFTPRNEMEIASTYFAFNDLGNFMGRIAHKMGFKYGHDGLTYQFRTMEDHVFDEYRVSKEPSEIFRFLGYDHSVYLQGFDELEDVFEFAASTPYFHKDIFLLHNRNNTSRVRDAKRKSYNEFLKWCETYDNKNAFVWDSFMEKGGRKNVEWCMERAFAMFPEFKKWHEHTEKRLAKHNMAIELFNGEVVKAITGLEFKELGDFMKHLRNDVIFSNLGGVYLFMDDYVVDALKDEQGVRNFIMLHYFLKFGKSC